MALHRTDKLSTIIGETAYSIRTDAFLAIFVANNGLDRLIGQIENQESRELLANHLELNPYFAELIRSYINHKRIPERLLDWVVDDSLRQTNWIYRNCTLHTGIPSMGHGQSYPTMQPQPIRAPATLTGKVLGIGLIDYYLSHQGGTLNDLIELNTNKKFLWEDSKKTDRFFAWLNQDDAESKRSAFYHWLSAKGGMNFFLIKEFQSHDQLLEFFDISKSTDSDKELLSQKFRRVWNQQRTRESRTDKKQFNFILSNSTNLKLEKLSKKYGLNRTQIIEIVIDSEAKHETYIKERLDRNRRLTNPL